MTLDGAARARRRGAVLTGLPRALWSARTVRAGLRATRALAIGAGIGLAMAALILVWLAAVLSLAEGPTGGSGLAVLYAVTAVGGPLLLPWVARAFGSLQRARFRAVLGVEIPAPPRVTGPWPVRLVRSWRAAATWRQLRYHLLALVVCVAGTAVVVACCGAVVLTLGYAAGLGNDGRRPGVALALALVLPALVLLVAAPWVALALARVDETAARALLGPSRSERLALRVESLTRSRADIVAATDAERRRIERDLHDGAQQRLVSLAMNLGMARANLVEVPDPVRAAIESAHAEAILALAELRDLVRGLHPAVLDDRGLDAALSGIAARAPLPVRLHVDAAARCSPSIEAIAYFVVSEALTNVAKHARASQADITVERAAGRLRVVIADDGRGGATLEPVTAGGGTGLRGLAQRAAAVDGTFSVTSPPGGPTTITVELPCES